jgi:hypothetical protein
MVRTLFVASLLCSVQAFAAPETVQVPSVPASLEELKALRDTLATTPQGGAAIFALALNMYSDRIADGAEYLGLVIDQSKISGREPSNMRDFKDRNLLKPYIAHSMIQGTSPASAYKLPALPWSIRVTSISFAKEDDVRVYIQTSGAPSPKPLQLKRNDKGIWKAVEWSSFQGNCVAPSEKKTDEL